jgi:TrmH RNA methyltransferase
MISDELRICGLVAVKARFERNPASIARLYFDAATARRIGSMCSALAQARKIYRCVEPAELEKVAGSVHHGGIVAVVSNPPPRLVTSADAVLWAGRQEPLVLLDRIGNAHNLGAIARTAAFFGVPRLVICGDPAGARPSDAAYRVAEGGLDLLETCIVSEIPSFLRALTGAGFDVVGAATQGGKAKTARPGAGRGSPPVAPWALVLGNEEHGLAPETAAACSRLVTIPGSGQIESLNVSAAAAILLRDLVRKT